MSTYAQTIWNYLIERIENPYGVAGLMGNLQAESNLQPNNLQNSYESKLGFTDSSYTNAVDNGTYTKQQFVNDSAGYGLAQWTYSVRKERLYDMYSYGHYSSIGSIELALDYLWYELSYEFTGVLKILKSATSVRQASDCVLVDFESPADQSESVKVARAKMGQDFYDTYADPTLYDNYLKIINAVDWAINIANDDSHGYDQTNRWGKDYDCSSFVITAYEQAGVPVKTNGATYTGNMESGFSKTGFQVLSYTSGMELIVGDVLWRSGHTAMYIGNGQNVEASINENGEVTGGKTGDQTGKEIHIESFSSSGSWTKVFRLPSSSNGGGGVIPTLLNRKKFKFILFGKRGFKLK